VTRAYKILLDLAGRWSQGNELGINNSHKEIDNRNLSLSDQLGRATKPVDASELRMSQQLSLFYAQT
jgi:hypothetical protein